MISGAREEAEGRAGDSAYRESAGWESVVHDAGFWCDWYWDEVSEELEEQAGELDLRWDTVSAEVRAAFEETFRASFG
ncbi:hypothetical protein ABZX40_32495 [Streptomyces sp. NPDC004610]|uniref:hypothetical protein n=1 Tax=unclassified Streptomyces TaxID=2593676 RepID=UPI0033B8ED90